MTPIPDETEKCCTLWFLTMLAGCLQLMVPPGEIKTVKQIDYETLPSDIYTVAEQSKVSIY